MSPFLRRHRYDLLLLATVAIWGANVPVLKATLREIPAGAANALRFTLGAVALGALARAEARRAGATVFGPLRAHLPRLLVLGFVGYFLYQEGFVTGVQRTSAASAALLMATSPLWTSLLSHFTGTQRLRGAGWAGLALSLAGAAVVVLGAGQTRGTDTLAGNALMLGSAMAWGYFTNASRALSGKVAPATAAFGQTLVALPLLYAVAVPTLGAFHPAALPLWVWGALVYSGALSVGLTFAAWNAGVAHVGPAATAAYSNLSPLVAAAVGFVLLGEPVTPLQALGGALLIGGLVWMRRGLAPSRPVAPEPVAVPPPAPALTATP